MEKPTTPSSSVPAVPKHTSPQPIKSPTLQQAPLQQVTQPTSLNQEAGDPPHSAMLTSSEPANAKNKKNAGLILIIGLSTVLIAITVAIFFTLNTEDNPTSSSDGDKSDELSYSFEIDEIRFITANEKKRYTLKADILDYLLVNRTNLDNCVEKVTGNNSYLNKIEFTPDIIPNTLKKPLLQFRETRNGALIYPSVNISTLMQKFTPDSGYIITGKTPESHTGDLKFKCFLKLYNCNPRISFKYKNEDSYIMPTKNGLYQVIINVANSAPNQDFEIRITHSESRSENVSEVEAITLYAITAMPLHE